MWGKFGNQIWNRKKQCEQKLTDTGVSHGISECRGDISDDERPSAMNRKDESEE